MEDSKMMTAKNPEGKKENNITLSKEGNFLVIKIDLTKELGPSKSKKTNMIASSFGAMDVLDTPAKLNLNLYYKG